MGDKPNSNQVNPRFYILIGPQGSGKGTQGKFIVERYNLQSFVMGDVCREIAKEPSLLGQKVKSIIDAGNYVPDDMLIEIFKERLKKIDLSKGVVFDSVARSIAQATALDNLMKELNLPLPFAIFININREIALDRLTKRRTCTSCYTTYLPANESYESGICEKCGGNVTVRTDDTEEGINRRLDQYYEKTAPIIDYYKNNSRLVEIDGNQSIEEVTIEIFAALDSK